MKLGRGETTAAMTGNYGNPFDDFEARHRAQGPPKHQLPDQLAWLLHPARFRCVFVHDDFTVSHSPPDIGTWAVMFVAELVVGTAGGEILVLCPDVGAASAPATDSFATSQSP